jgi:type III pantothenate kinase
MIVRIKNELQGSVTVIATGGLAPLFKDAVKGIDHMDPDLTLRGLYLIHKRNNGSHKS